MNSKATRTTIDVVVNGKNVTITAGSTIHDILHSRQINPSHAVIEINLNIIPREEYYCRELKNNDSIEILRFVGGG